eukprot:gene5712-6412_t
MAVWPYLVAVAGSYICTSYVFFRYPTLLHKKKKHAFNCRHISHRGGAGENLENTMTAFRHAVNVGTEMIELDVQLTKDKQVVVSHDNNLIRVTGINTNISDLEYKDLPLLSESLDVTFTNKEICRGCEDRVIPLLKDVFEEFPNLPINLDVKTHNEELMLLVHKMICDYERKQITVWGNVNAKTTEMLHKLDADIPLLFSFKRCILLLLAFYTGFLPFLPMKESYLEVIMPSPFLRWRDLMSSRTQRFLVRVVDFVFMNSWLFKHLERRGIKVFLWVLNEDQDFERAFKKLGAAAVMTDYPTRLTEYLNRDKKNS